MNFYQELKQKQQKEFNEFPMFFAFNQEQFDEGLKKLKVKQKDLISIGYGGFIKKSSNKAFCEMTIRHSREHKSNFNNETYLYDMFLHELANHEYVVTLDLEETLSACQLDKETVYKNNLILNVLRKAESDYLKSVD